jgi:hypothetical protein
MRAKLNARKKTVALRIVALSYAIGRFSVGVAALAIGCFSGGLQAASLHVQ